MEHLSTVTTASSLLSSTLNALKAVRERAQTSKDHELKESISKLYDCVLSLKESVMLLTDENKELRRRIAELEQPPEKPLPELRQVGDVNYYFVADKFLGDKGPYCQPCYDRDEKLVQLSPQQDWNGGKRRECVVCGEYFQESKGAPVQIPMTRFRGPNGWMGN